MDSSYWTNLNLKHNVKESNHLFFNKYQYSIRGTLQEVNAVRDLNPESIDQRLRIKKRFLKSHPSHHPFYRFNNISSSTKTNLIEFINFINGIDCQYRLTVSTHTFHIYTDDVSLLVAASKLSGVVSPEVTQVKIVCSEDKLYQKNPKHNYRLYVHKKTVTLSDKEQLSKFIKTYKDEVTMCKAFKRWLGYSSKYCYDYFFIDYNDPGMAMIFEMFVPGLSRKTYTITGEKIDGKSN